MNKLIYLKTTLTALLCTIALGNSHGMETGNTANPTHLLKTSYMSADWNFNGAKTTYGSFTDINDNTQTITALQIKDESLKFEHTRKTGFTLVSIPSTGGRNLIIRQSEDIMPLTEGDIKSLMNSQAKKVRFFSAPIVCIENELFKFNMNHKGCEDSVITPIYELTKNMAIISEQSHTIRITSPFTFALINSGNNILVQGQVVNTGGMMDVLRTKIIVSDNRSNNTINKTNTTEYSQCIVS